MIRTLTGKDADAYAALRHEMLVEAPLAFASSPEDAAAQTLEQTRETLGRGPESVVFGAFEPELVGAVGIYRDPHVKASHKAYVWGMYVRPAHRARGIAAGLLEAALAHATKLRGIDQVQLGVSSAAPEARRLYQRAGFEQWGAEPDALRHRGDSIVEYHLTRRL